MTTTTKDTVIIKESAVVGGIKPVGCSGLVAMQQLNV